MVSKTVNVQLTAYFPHWNSNGFKLHYVRLKVCTMRKKLILYAHSPAWKNKLVLISWKAILRVVYLSQPFKVWQEWSAHGGVSPQ